MGFPPMPVQIGDKQQSGPGDPIGWLTDCHRRIERFLQVLLTVTEKAGGGVLSEAQRVALENALRYFRDAVPQHTADEEESLFPRLRKIDTASLQEALHLLAGLERDHRTAEEMHVQVDLLGAKWLTDGHLENAQAARLAELLNGLKQTYAEHIDMEDNQVFPAADKVLPASDRIEVGREMAARRGTRE